MYIFPPPHTVCTCGVGCARGRLRGPTEPAGSPIARARHIVSYTVPPAPGAGRAAGRRGGSLRIRSDGMRMWLKKSLSKFKKNDSTHSHTIHLVTGASVTAAHDEWESVLLSALLPTLE